MSLLPLSRPIDRVWLRAGFEKREVTKSSEEGRENMCRIFILITPPQTGQDVEIRAGFVDHAADYHKSVLGYNQTQLGGRKLLVSPI